MRFVAGSGYTFSEPALGSPSCLRALASLPLMLEHSRPALDFAQPITIPDELRANPELGFDSQRGFELQRRLGGDAFFATEDVSDLGDRHAHSRCERGLRQSTALDELLAQYLTWTLGWLRRRNADGEDQEETSRVNVRTRDEDCGAA